MLSDTVDKLMMAGEIDRLKLKITKLEKDLVYKGEQIAENNLHYIYWKSSCTKTRKDLKEIRRLAELISEKASLRKYPEEKPEDVDPDENTITNPKGC